ncbi:unnamed protein product [Trifolium pratense]|uniref:Uncharacterized protein n=1 Tax=Trifolium pratense TaxID=57577 RepID=A0ACB0LCT1_TRIPR|nr:unnamed protein product [Trifolium pratense]
MAHVVKEYKLAVHANKIASEVQHDTIWINWKAPPYGWVKMNSYGLCKDNGIAGCGGLIRGCNGEWFGGYAKNIGKCSAYVVEFWGVLEGLKLARRLGFQAIEVNVDSHLVANTPSGPFYKEYFHYFGKKIWSFL